MNAKKISSSRISTMVSAAQGFSDFSPATDVDRWLQDAWGVIQWRIKIHTEAGRTYQACAWRQVARFFARRYDGMFSA